MKKTVFFLLIFAVSIFAACQYTATNSPPASAPSTEKSNFKEISTAEARAAVKNEDIQFIDVRTAAEYASGHAPNAVNFPLDNIENDLGKLDKSKPVYVICETGKRSQKASEILTRAGFSEVFSISGGTSEWIAAGFPVEKVSVDSKHNLG